MRDVIVDHADLLDEERIPDLLLEVCAHVAAYEAILKRWEKEDYREHATPINFPSDKLRAYAGAGVRRLKSEQQQLLKIAARSLPVRSIEVGADGPNRTVDEAQPMPGGAGRCLRGVATQAV